MRAIDADALIEFCAERWIPLNIDAVNMQPTIKPVATDTNVGNNSEIPNSSGCISRQAAIDAIKALWNDAPSAQHVSAMFDCEDAIRALPSAQPEIIRCRERKYSNDMPIADGKYWCNYHNGYFSFCSEAKRKEE